MPDDLKAARIARLRAATEVDLDLGLPKVPEHLREGLRRYVLDGGRVGQFLAAAIENNLLGAISHGDDQSLAGLKPLVKFLYNDAPSPCWGSRERREAWQAQGGLAGMIDS